MLVDGETKVIESFAILDYLEAAYPSPALMPADAAAIGTVRMVQMVTLNELLTALAPLTRKMMGFDNPDQATVEKAQQQTMKVLQFCQDKLAGQLWYGGDQVTLAEMVLGTVTPWLTQMEVDLADVPEIQDWTQRLMARQAWQMTQPTEAAIAAFRDRMRQLMAQRQG